jgi:hypothetical protein
MSYGRWNWLAVARELKARQDWSGRVEVRKGVRGRGPGNSAAGRGWQKSEWKLQPSGNRPKPDGQKPLDTDNRTC